MRTLLQALGAVFPFVGAMPSPRGGFRGPGPTASKRAAAATLATRAQQTSETTETRPRRSADPYYLQVVPFVPADVSPRPQRLMHPRIVNPFRHFPRRAHHLFALMEQSPSAPAGTAATTDPQY